MASQGNNIILLYVTMEVLGIVVNITSTGGVSAGTSVYFVVYTKQTSEEKYKYIVVRLENITVPPGRKRSREVHTCHCVGRKN